MSKGPMSIRDYLARLEPIKDLSRRAKTSSLRPDAAADPFSRLLASSLARNSRKPRIGSGGLTAVDYLTNPIPTTRCIQWKVCSNSQPPARPEAITVDTQEKSAKKLSSPAVPKDAPAYGAQLAAAPSRHKPSRISLIRNDIAAQTIDSCIRESAEKYGMAPELIRAVVKAESNFKIDAVSVAGAQGLMQLMPATARELGVHDPFDIRQNIDGGTRYLRQMLDQFGGDIRLALSAYNAGPGNVLKYKGNVPFPETQRYVSRVLNAVRQTV